MYRIAIILLVLCVNLTISVLLIKPFYNIGDSEALFRKFKITYGKKYVTKLEDDMRLKHFINTLIDINHLNSINKDAIFDINEYSDLSKEEFAITQTGFKKKESSDRFGHQNVSDDPPCTMFYDTNITSTSTPEAFDWRDLNVVTPVRKQGKCGSCWAFSIVSNIESQVALLSHKLVQFSTQQLVDCVTSSDGCDGGDTVESARALITHGGIELEADYPYKAKDQNCSLDASKIAVKVTGCNNFVVKDEEKLKQVLYQTGPLSIVIDAQFLHSYSGGILEYCPRHEENHAVVLVGYGKENDEDFWVIKNSWGTKWGENGFFRLKRGINACGIINDKVVSAVIQM